MIADKDRSYDDYEPYMLKRKFRRRKIIIIIASILIVIVAIGIYNYFKPPVIDYGSSEMYTKQDIESVMQIIKDRQSGSSKLLSISYVSDYLSERELDYWNSLDNYNSDFTECMVLITRFRTPLFGNLTMEPNSIYEWNWIFARTENGPWQLITNGQG